MRLLCLNCCGLGNPETVRELHDLVKIEDPQVLFLSETRLAAGNSDWVRVKLGFGSSLVVNQVGLGGGLMLLWTDSSSVSIRSYSPHHIDASVTLADGIHWRFTGFYGQPMTSRRFLSWELLRRLGTANSEPWLVAGDFNEITEPSEKTGTYMRPLPQMEAFYQVLFECNLQDMGFLGSPFTWYNRRGENDLVLARLDRGVCNNEWASLYPSFRIRYISFASSNHSTIAIDLMGEAPNHVRRKKLFRFDHTWVKLEGCEDKIREAWSQCFEG